LEKSCKTAAAFVGSVS